MRLAAWFCAAVVLLGAGPAAAQTVAGDWTAFVAYPFGIAVRFSAHISRTPDGFAGTLHRPGRNASSDTPLTNILQTGDTLSFKTMLDGNLPVSFVSKWDAATGHWIGQFLSPVQPKVGRLTLVPGWTQ